MAGGLLDAEHGQDDRFRLLARVTGGSSPVQVLQPLRPALPDMGGPKYSAAWWDLVRSRGLDR